MKKLIKTVILITIVSQSSFAQSQTGHGHVTLLKKNAAMATNSVTETTVNNDNGITTVSGTTTTSSDGAAPQQSNYVGHVTLLRKNGN